MMDWGADWTGWSTARRQEWRIVIYAMGLTPKLSRAAKRRRLEWVVRHDFPHFLSRPVIPTSPRHQREHTTAQVFARVSGVALGFRG